jgi:DNA polymerase-3 subunit epsilon
MREIVLDTETTGISALEGHRVIEIGAVEMVNKYRTGKHYHVYINPERSISEGALKVHGITEEFLKDKPVFQLIVADFLEFIGDSRLVIHNAPFDMGFINHHLVQLGIKPLENERVTDTLEIARKKYPGAKNNLDALCARLGIDTSSRVHHGALLDAELLADAYAEMMGAGATQRNLLYGHPTHKEEQKQAIVAQAGTKFYEPRPFSASAEELAKHEEFTNSLKNPLWKTLAS